jgi:hypothetical protein
MKNRDKKRILKKPISNCSRGNTGKKEEILPIQRLCKRENDEESSHSELKPKRNPSMRSNNLNDGKTPKIKSNKSLKVAKQKKRIKGVAGPYLIYKIKINMRCSKDAL